MTNGTAGESFKVEIADLLDATADLIETEGRARGAAYVDGKSCLVASVFEVARRQGLPRRVAWSAINLIERHSEVGTDIVQFNDTTEDDQVVLDVLRSTAKGARS